ncbi:hypothetical protein BAUCODRAFT_122166 [Baudoinia panamericana UAMH 10762]|uniref:Fe2OG dioxygenase domain-containing protein n=1 Tax=Baudoinia panamericana (strain UAMH 10762) TaxID=717646 RepID=M2NFG7_BAUPA|nr:uncharacterized protein BAUCODRAFT_122166 [Baudoinia panamericana UAMH 10762]EMC97740.1 hypothetical protein BAUCODRAFT_122166 [Baudoinia panamericana UAMH 10762]
MAKGVTIRWGQHGEGRVVTLPCRPSVSGSSEGTAALPQLIADCTPATFGHDGKDVYDPSYRLAGAMSAQDFTTDFCPYETGIIDMITQILMRWRGLRAELYKLNVYSGPSGMFKSHVDTPRGEKQVGSLVVCLPVAFQGGGLAVRHGGQQIVHEWSTFMTDEAASCVQWAAFYSDCEHEVLPVIEGHRVTLTYNLYLAHGTGLLAQGEWGIGGLQPAQLPLSQHLRDLLLAKPVLMPNGGYLGFDLTHLYPHTHPSLHAFVPQMLKGADLAVYEAVQAAGLTCVLGGCRNDHHFEQIDILDKLDAQDRRRRRNEVTGWGREAMVNALTPLRVDDSGDYHEQEVPLEESFDEVEVSKVKDLRARVAIRERITWVNVSGHDAAKELSFAGLAYGNQAELKVRYSNVALVAKVPNAAERGLKVV